MAPPAHASISVAAATAAGTAAHRSGKGEGQSRWRLGRPIGECEGSFGRVCRALDERGHNGCRLLAVRSVPAQGLGEEDLDILIKEVALCSQACHPNVLSYYGCALADGHVLVGMELASHSVACALRDAGPLEEPLLQRIVRGIVAGLDHLHSLSPQIVHGNLRASNVLMDADGCAKLSDYGCSVSMLCPEFLAEHLPWMAPEVAAGVAEFGEASDVWSLGCTILEMATAERPWSGRAIGGYGAAADWVPEGLSEECVDLMLSCLQWDAEARPSTDELLGFEFCLEDGSEGWSPRE